MAEPRTSPGSEQATVPRRGGARAWLLTVVAVAVAAVLTALFFELFERSIFLLFLLAVLLSAWWGNRWTGLLACVLSLVACAWLLPPRNSLYVADTGDVLRLAIFFTAAAVMALLTGSLREAQVAARAARAAADVRAAGLDRTMRELEGQIAEKRELVERLERAFAEEHQARSRAEDEAAAREETIAVVAHDLRNPLNLIGMNAALIRDLNPPIERRAVMLASIFSAVDQMERFIRDLLDAARIEAGHLSLRLAPVDAVALVHRAVAGFETMARQRGVELEVDIAETSPLVADPDRALQALSNLVANAVKFSDPGGRVVVAVRELGGVAQFEVTDTGPGIQPTHREHLFDRFWQAAKGDRRGTGLGLPIAKGIAEAHGGRIVVETEPGAGSTFIMELPLHTPATP